MMLIFALLNQNTCGGGCGEDMYDRESEGVSVTFTLHRWTGYGIILGSLINVGTGIYILNQYQNGEVPPDFIRITHRALGYTVFTLSTFQSSIGVYNSLKLWNEPGKFRRLVHGALASAATGSYLYAGYLAYKGRYVEHRNWMLVASGLSALAGIWIIF